MMAYVYHRVPADMTGQKLLPLNELKKSQPELYDKYTKKYMDHPKRKHLLMRKIPKLNCYWNDVIHLLPIDPTKVYGALREAGMNEKDMLFYQIPLSLFPDHAQFAFYHYRPEAYEGPGSDMKDSEITLVNRDHFQCVEYIRKETKSYYEESIRENRPFGLFHYIPHIFYRGSINITETEIISWKEKTISPEYAKNKKV
ncbi:group-specific protein [Evansella halocellulosilytica]|uniref:group-specific protein n=1 Tax=Evansella halocellulosilytica TaxID=2011013 RepID=UPI001C53F90F|nr:group-specific protein [Evansella halocellulosilytica]